MSSRYFFSETLKRIANSSITKHKRAPARVIEHESPEASTIRMCSFPTGIAFGELRLRCSRGFFVSCNTILRVCHAHSIRRKSAHSMRGGGGGVVIGARAAHTLATWLECERTRFSNRAYANAHLARTLHCIRYLFSKLCDYAFRTGADERQRHY